MVATIFRRHRFRVHDNVPGYTGGNIVATFGEPRARRVHALQIEINASLLIAESREELVALISRGGVPEKAEASIAHVRRCLEEVVATLPAVLAAVDAP
jgi:N-formylglutamate amidohydrolase